MSSLEASNRQHGNTTAYRKLAFTVGQFVHVTVVTGHEDVNLNKILVYTGDKSISLTCTEQNWAVQYIQ